MGGSGSLSKSSSQPDLALLVNQSDAGNAFDHDSNRSHRIFQAADSRAITRVSADSDNAGRRTASFAASSSRDDSPLHVIRIWRSSDGGREQSSKLVPLRKHTTALEATRLAADEFGVPDDDRDAYCLCQVTVEEGPLTKQSRIADHVDDLSSRTSLNSRYYFKCNRKSDALVNDDVARQIHCESKVSLLQLSPEELCTQLTLSDYAVFRSVEAAEYVDKVFGLVVSAIENVACSNSQGTTVVTPSVGSASSGYSSEQESASIATQDVSSCSSGFPTGFDNLDRFSELVNREAYWVPSEVCAEPTISKRVDALKRFIKMAKLCRDLRNYNTMFCILVGLNMAPVERLRQTWERLPNKYAKLCRDLALILDPSRNFFHYRNLITTESPQAPMIPYLPLILKDLTFIHLGNPSRSNENLVNFSKLRMIAKEIRALRRMCSAEYEASLAQRLIQAGTSGGRGAVSVLSGFAGFSDSKQSDSNSPAKLNFLTDPPPKSSDRVSKKSLDSSATATVALSVSAGVSSALVGAYSSPGKRSVSPNFGVSFTIGDSSASSLWPGVGQLPTRRRSNANSLKKLHEAWLMNLRVRTYLSSLRVVDDLDVLTQMSNKLEPGPRSTGDCKQFSTSQSSTSVTPTPSDESASMKGKDSVNSGSLPTEAHAIADDSSRLIDPHSSPPIRSGESCHAGAIFGAQSLADTRRLLMLNERSRKTSRRVPYFFLPTSNNGDYFISNSSNYRPQYPVCSQMKVSSVPSSSAQGGTNYYNANSHPHSGPPCHQVGSSAGQRWSMDSSQSADLRSLNSLIPTTARLPPSNIQYLHHQNHAFSARQRACLRPGYFVDSSQVSCPSSQRQIQQLRRASNAHQDSAPSQRMINPQAFSNRCVPMQRNQQQHELMYPNDRPRSQQRPSTSRGVVRVQPINSPPIARQCPQNHQRSGTSQPPLRQAQQPDVASRPQPPPYEHALGLRQQRTISCGSSVSNSLCTVSNHSYPMPPPHQIADECDPNRRNPNIGPLFSSNCVSSLYNHSSDASTTTTVSLCPSMFQTPHHLTTTACQLSDSCRTPPLSRPLNFAQRLERPPLPSYNQALALKHEKPLNVVGENSHKNSLQAQNSHPACTNIRDFRSS